MGTLMLGQPVELRGYYRGAEERHEGEVSTVAGGRLPVFAAAAAPGKHGFRELLQ